MRCPNVVLLSDRGAVHEMAICCLQMLPAFIYIFIVWGGGDVSRKRAGMRGFCWGAAQVASHGARDLHKTLAGLSATWERMSHPKSPHTDCRHLWRRCEWAAIVTGQIAAYFFFLLDQTGAVLLLNLTIPTLQLPPVCVFVQNTFTAALLQGGCL